MDYMYITYSYGIVFAWKDRAIIYRKLSLALRLRSLLLRFPGISSKGRSIL